MPPRSHFRWFRSTTPDRAITGARLKHDGKDVLAVYVRGALCGVLRMGKGDGELAAAEMGLVPRDDGAGKDI